MRVVVLGFDITAWMAAAAAVLRGHEVTLVVTRGAIDPRVVAANQHPGQWLLAKTGDAARLLSEAAGRRVSDGDYKISTGVRDASNVLRPLQEWIASAGSGQVFALHCQHSLRTGRTTDANESHFGLIERALLSKSYIRHVDPDETALELVRFVRSRCDVRVVATGECIVDVDSVWFDGQYYDFDLMLFADRAHRFVPSGELAALASCRAGTPIKCTAYRAASLGEDFVHHAMFSTTSTKLALATMDGSDYWLWTYGDEDRDAVRRDVANGFCSGNVQICEAVPLFGGYATAPRWTLPDNIMPIGWQALGEVTSVDEAVRQVHERLGFEYDTEIQPDVPESDDEDAVLEEP